MNGPKTTDQTNKTPHILNWRITFEEWNLQYVLLKHILIFHFVTLITDVVFPEVISKIDHISPMCFSVPGAVGNLSLMECGSSFLRVNWTSAPGDVDHYEVQILFNDTQVSPAVNLSSTVREHLFSALTPGRLYKMVLSTHSGSYQRAEILEGRTGTARFLWIKCNCLKFLKYLTPKSKEKVRKYNIFCKICLFFFLIIKIIFICNKSEQKNHRFLFWSR